MSTNESVDVVIPAYNCASWIGATINSVLAQTHSNVNILVVDDCSTDDTSKVVHGISDYRVKYIKTPMNSGSSAARNFGMKKCTSKYIALLDSDDLWYPEKLQKQLQLLQSDSSLGLVFCGIYVTDENRVITRNLIPHKKVELDDLYSGNLVVGSASTVVLRKSVVDEVGYFEESLVNGEDWEYWLRIADVSGLGFVPDILAEIKTRSDSIQANRLRMANELVRTCSFINNTHQLTHKRRVLLHNYCLGEAIKTYRSLGKHKDARKQMLHLLIINKHMAIIPSTWRIRIAPSQAASIIFTNKVSRVLNAQIDNLWRFADLVMDRIYARLTRR